jgi:hypothetical protein
VKVCERNSVEAAREVEVYAHLDQMTTSHAGALSIRLLLDAFKLPPMRGGDGFHQCFVYKPLGMSLSRLRRFYATRKLPETVLKQTLIHLLFALDLLHTEAEMVHSGENALLFKSGPA